MWTINFFWLFFAKYYTISGKRYILLELVFCVLQLFIHFNADDKVAS